MDEIKIVPQPRKASVIGEITTTPSKKTDTDDKSRLSIPAAAPRKQSVTMVTVMFAYLLLYITNKTSTGYVYYVAY